MQGLQIWTGGCAHIGEEIGRTRVPAIMLPALTHNRSSRFISKHRLRFKFIAKAISLLQYLTRIYIDIFFKMTEPKIGSKIHLDLDAIIQTHLPDLSAFEEVYKDIHSQPELRTFESRTSEIASRHLKDLGFEVTDNVGGHGVIGNFANGVGRTLILRADMDALPIRENTGLPYASEIMFKDLSGSEKPVMHACGHDMHVTPLMATASLLVKAKERWSGTLTCISQPNEENGAGAMAMVNEGLYNQPQSQTSS